MSSLFCFTSSVPLSTPLQRRTCRHSSRLHGPARFCSLAVALLSAGLLLLVTPASASVVDTAVAPTIDGIITAGEWDIAEVEFETGPSDCGASAWNLSGAKGRFLWDATNLYGVIEAYPNICGPGANPDGPFDNMNWEAYINANGWPAAMFLDTTSGAGCNHAGASCIFSGDRMVLELSVPIASIIDNTSTCPGSLNCPNPYTFNPAGGDFLEYDIAISDQDAAGGFSTNGRTEPWVVEPPLSGYQQWRKLNFTVFVPECSVNADCDDQIFCNGDETCDQGRCSDGSDPCDDGVTCTDDSCDEDTDTCTNTANDANCDDSLYCNGAETCDSIDDCQSGTAIDCSSLGGGDCSEAECDEGNDECAVTAINEGDPCSDGSDCTLAATCVTGECVASAETTLAPSCRWFGLAGAPAQTVKVRAEKGSSMTGGLCGDEGQLNGVLSAGASIAATAAAGTGILFRTEAQVDGDIATGGADVTTGSYAFVPGTTETLVAGGQIVARVDELGAETGAFVDTTGTGDLVVLCAADQTKMAAAAAVLDGLTQTEDRGTMVIRRRGSGAIDTTGDPQPAVIDMTKLRVGGRSTLTITAGATDVVVLRAARTIRIGFGAEIVLAGGLLPENLLFYGKGTGNCRVGRTVTGSGSFYCPAARRILVGNDSQWEGSFMGATRQMRIRTGATLLHQPFVGQ